MTDPTALAPVPGFVDLRTRLTAGETLYGTFTGLGSPAATELVARAGFDWLIIDLEHGVGTESELLANLHAVGATRTAALVRPQSGERLRIGRALDLGAHGIMVPHIDTAEQAREAVSFLRYPPDGTRRAARGWASSGTRTSGRSTRTSSASSRSSRPVRSTRRPASRPSTAWTSCSSARPTCRTASASRASSPIRATAA